MSDSKSKGVALSKGDFIIAGSLSGLVSRAVVQPLDVLKIRFQLQVEPIRPNDAGKYRGFIQAIRCINKEEGTVAFWKGHVPAQLQAVTFSAIQFLSFEMLVTWVVGANAVGEKSESRFALRSINPLQTFLCGSLAGSFAAGLTQPLDVLRTRFIAQGEPKLYRSIAHAAIHIASREGLPGFFRGVVPSLLLIALQTGFQFAIYHTFNQIVGTLHSKWAFYKSTEKLDRRSTPEYSQVGPVQSLISGGLAGMGAKCVVYPLDMVKKRMQIHGFEEARASFGRVPVNHNIRSSLLSIWNTEGAAALFKGLRPTLLKSCVSLSCRFTVYEQFCRLLYYMRNTDVPNRRTF